MNFMDIINVPLGLILKGIYWIIGDYGWSILVFALLARIIMLPSAIKTQKNQLKMQKLQPKIKQLNNKYHNNTRDPKYQQEMQDLYAKEGYNPLSGCLPMLIQMPVIFGLWNVIRQPLTYICNFSESNLYNAVKVAVESGVQNESIQKLTEVFGKVITDGKLVEWGKEVKDLIKLNEIYIADMINSNGTLDNLMEAIEQKAVVNTEFLGINLGKSASAHGLWSPFILVPIIAAASSFLSSWISMRKSRSQSNSDDPTAKSMNTMLYTMPILSLFIGYSMNFGVALYWIASNLFSLLQIVLLPMFMKEKVEEKPVKEKKLNYTQIEKERREAEALQEPAKKNKKK